MRYAARMSIKYTLGVDDFLDELDPDAERIEWHVSVHEGSIWLSQEALDDLEFFTGRRVVSEHPRDVLEFLDREAAQLQGPTISDGAAEMNMTGYALIQGIRHAIISKMFGPEFAGDFPHPDELAMSFHSTPRSLAGLTLH